MRLLIAVFAVCLTLPVCAQELSSLIEEGTDAIVISSSTADTLVVVFSPPRYLLEITYADGDILRVKEGEGENYERIETLFSASYTEHAESHKELSLDPGKAPFGCLIARVRRTEGAYEIVQIGAKDEARDILESINEVLQRWAPRLEIRYWELVVTP